MSATATQRRRTPPEPLPDAITVGGKRVPFSNLDKVLYPAGFTKADTIAYYLRIAPTILVHLKNRGITLKRYPNGSRAPFFFEKNCPAHRPEWVKTAHVTSGRAEGEGIDF